MIIGSRGSRSFVAMSGLWRLGGHLRRRGVVLESRTPRLFRKVLKGATKAARFNKI